MNGTRKKKQGNIPCKEEIQSTKQLANFGRWFLHWHFVGVTIRSNVCVNVMCVLMTATDRPTDLHRNWMSKLTSTALCEIDSIRAAFEFSYRAKMITTTDLTQFIWRLNWELEVFFCFASTDFSIQSRIVKEKFVEKKKLSDKKLSKWMKFQKKYMKNGNLAFFKNCIETIPVSCKIFNFY